MRRHVRVWELVREVVDELWPDGLAAARGWERDGMADYCPRCGASVGPGAMLATGCAFCAGERLTWDRLYRLGVYGAPLDGWIRRAKFQRDWRWSVWMGEQLGEVVGGPMDAERVMVCPVPMHWGRRWQRGYNQARLMAEGLATSRQWLLADVLYRPKRRQPQTAVEPSQRQANVAGSFACRAVDLAGWEVVLVDDVKTSGATLSSCARLLRQAGAKSVVAAVAAVADPKGYRFTRI